jgi:hypothetical protein
MGQTYELTAWVRAGPQDGPQNLEVAVREYDESNQPHPHRTSVTPEAGWQAVTATLTVESAAPDNVDVYFASTAPAEGNCFQVDAVCLVLK